MGPVGILGGTFDPVHHGHLRLALELYEALDLDSVHLIPLHDPSHRVAPETAPEHRLAMLELAVEGVSGLVADAREHRRGGISYSVDSLEELRAELGPEVPLCLFVGMDAFHGLQDWHRWARIPALAHIVVVHRPGAALPDAGDCQRRLGLALEVDPGVLLEAPAGSLLLMDLPLLDISSTRIRALLAAGRNPRYLLPEAVIAYLRTHRLYGVP